MATESFLSPSPHVVTPYAPTESNPGTRVRRAAWHRGLWIVSILLGIVVAGWLGWRSLSESEAVTRPIEERILQASGLLVEIHTVTPGFGGVELHGFRAVDEERDIEIWADVVRLDLDVRALRNPRQHDLPAQFEGVRVTLPNGQVLTSRRFSARRKATGVIESMGRGALEGKAGQVHWDIRATEDLSRFEGLVELDGLELGSTRELLHDALPGPIDLRDASADGRLAFGRRAPVEESSESTVTASKLDEILWDSDLTFSGISLRSERLAGEPIRDLELAVVGQGSLQVAERRVRFDQATVTLNGIDARLVGLVASGPDGFRVDLGVQLPDTTCEKALRAIPVELLGEVADFRMAGAISAAVKLELDSQRPEATVFDVAMDDRCAFREVPRAVRLERFSRPFQLTVLDEEGEPYAYETGPGTQAWSDYEEISPFMVQAVMAHEDASFPEHHGFAVFAIENSLEANLRAGEVVRGASTISMQLAKNLFLDREKTLARKAREVILTWWLEKSLGKRQIMELYLNVIEYGPKVYGIRQAAQHYFGVEPADLTPAQSVFLATLLPSPVARHQQFEDGDLFASTRREIGFLLRHMHRKGRIQTAALDYGLWELKRKDFFRPSWIDRVLGPGHPEARPALDVVASHSLSSDRPALRATSDSFRP